MDMTEDELRQLLPPQDPKQYFASREEFEQFMQEIDLDLREQKIPVVGRQLKGHSEAAKRLRTDLYFVPKKFAKEGDYSNPSLSAHISNWFSREYGDRLKVDFANVRTICTVGGDLYKVRIPLVFSKPRLVFTGNRETLPNTINIGSLIDDLTDEKLQRITDDEIKYLAERVYHGCYLAHRYFSLDKELFQDAFADFKTSVDMLFYDQPLYGQSRWACLQFVEKIMKAYLNMQGLTPPRVHRLGDLSALIGEADIDADLVDRIQCSADMRYNSKLSNEEDCVKSHEAAQIVAAKVFSLIKQSP